MGRYSEDSEWEAGGEMRPTKVSSKEQKVMKEADDASAGAVPAPAYSLPTCS